MHMSMSKEDREAQEDELLALASIYADDEFRRAENIQGGQITACFDLPQGFRIFVNGEEATSPLKGHFEVSFLPPVLLTFELPSDYPSASPPVFELSCKWLTPMQVQKKEPQNNCAQREISGIGKPSFEMTWNIKRKGIAFRQLSFLRKQLNALWEVNKGRVVLFAWMQFLKEGALQHLNILSPYEVKVHSKELCCHKHVTEDQEQQAIATCEGITKRELLGNTTTKDTESLDSLIREILDFDQAQQLKSFQAKPYLCNICFSEKLGSECTQFKVCQHVYCNDCLRGYFEVQIKEGQVHLLHCPEPKCGSLSTPAQVKELVGEELFDRYDRLLLQSSLNSMADVVYCPSLNCQTPVMKEPGGAMGICTKCRFPFCALCNKTYHGVTACEQPEAEDDDENQPANGKSRKQMPLTHTELRRLKREKLYRKFVTKNCKKCPCCGIDIEKNGGCYRMNCSHCLKSFCWDCARPMESKPFQTCDCSHGS